MRYLVSIKAEASITRTVHVEAATEEEARQSAYQAVLRNDRLVPGSFEVTELKEDPPYENRIPRGGRVGRMF